MELKAPNGDEIQGTYELVPGASGVVFDMIVDAGFEHDGSGTDMFWDAAMTQEICGAVLFTDKSGNDWQQHHLIPADAEPLPQDTIDTMATEDFLGQAIDEAEKFIASMNCLRKNGINVAYDLHDTIATLKALHAAVKQKVAEMMQRNLAAQVRESEEAE